MEKSIKIFLASSITEFKNERMELYAFIENIGRQFRKNYNIDVEPFICENDDPFLTPDGRKQLVYNSEIENSEMVFFIFFTKCGEFTKEEFEIATNRMRVAGKPKIYTYFKTLADDEIMEESLKNFMKTLDETIGHYHCNFEHLDTIKLRILLNLKLQEMDFIEIKTGNGKCVVDGENIMPLDNISEFANNKELIKLQQELSSIEEEYFNMKPIYAQGDCGDEFYKKYSSVASKRQNLINEIEELQKQIFEVSIRMSYDNVRGNISYRQKEAYRLFELGDYNGCMAVLDSDEMDEEFIREEKMAAEHRVIRRRKYINEYNTKIEILKAMNNYPNRFSEITECYEKIVPFALEEKIEPEIVYNYLVFLYDQNRNERVIKLSKKFEEAYSVMIGADDDLKAKIYELRASIYERKNDYPIAEENYAKSIVIREKIVENSGHIGESDLAKLKLAQVYRMVGGYYLNQRKLDVAEMYFLKAIDIQHENISRNIYLLPLDLVHTYDALAVTYNKHGKHKDALKYYTKSINVQETLAKSMPEDILPSLALSYNNMAIFYDEQGNFESAEKYILKGLEIVEKLAEENPEKYNPDLARIYNNIGAFYNSTTSSEIYCLKAIRIQEKLANIEPARFLPLLATAYNNLANAYVNQPEKTEIAKDYYIKALTIREELYNMNPSRFYDDLAVSYNAFGVFCYSRGENNTSEEFYLKAIGIREEMLKDNCEDNIFALSTLYSNMGLFYAKIGKTDAAEQYHLKAIALGKDLSNRNPDRYTMELAMTYFNYACLKKDNQLFAKSLELASNKPDHQYYQLILTTLINALSDMGNAEE